jgi:tRNA uridine 5-carboxymethylaminomethyl modification enzyme
MFTSRAENRLFLRADTAPLRLCHIAIKNNMLNKKEVDLFLNFQTQYNNLYKKINKTKIIHNEKRLLLRDLLKRPEINITQLDCKDLRLMIKAYDSDVVFSVETAIKYAGYEQREIERIQKIKKLDGLKIPKKTNYTKIINLSSESKEKLSIVRPETLGQASRIAGVRPTDVTVLSIYLTTNKK